MDETLIVITSYPPKSAVHADGVGGVAGYAKNSLKSLVGKWPGKIVVLTEVLDKEEKYIENGVKVIRCWRPGSFSLYKTLFTEIQKISGPKSILVHFEFMLYGGLGVTWFFPFFLILLKTNKVTVLMHQVVLDLKTLSGHLGMKKDSLKIKLFNPLLKIYYFLIGLSADRIVVMEWELRQRLLSLGISESKSVFIPHGVDTSIRSESKNRARKMLGIAQNKKVVLVFGYVAWYKGVDIAIKAVAKLVKNAKKEKLVLIIAGGESFTQKDKAAYKKYFDFVEGLVKDNKQCIQLTGFVKEKDIRKYFSASDLVIFPYRVLMSSSGPLALALAFRKPILVSDKFVESLSFDLGTKLPDYMVSKVSVEGFAKGIKTFFGNTDAYEKTDYIYEKIRDNRSYTAIASQYIELLSGAKSKSAPFYRENPNNSNIDVPISV